MHKTSQKPSVAREKQAILKPAESSNVEPPTPPEIVELLHKVDLLIREDQPKKALDLLTRTRSSSRWAVNAQSVCQLRLGNAGAALDILRSLVFHGGVYFQADSPAVFKTNFAVASLMTGGMQSAASVLRGMRKKEHPAVGTLKAAIGHWKQGLTLGQKINWYMGGEPARPFTPDFPPGDLQ